MKNKHIAILGLGIFLFFISLFYCQATAVNEAYYKNFLIISLTANVFSNLFLIGAILLIKNKMKWLLLLVILLNLLGVLDVLARF